MGGGEEGKVQQYNQSPKGVGGSRTSPTWKGGLDVKEELGTWRGSKLKSKRNREELGKERKQLEVQEESSREKERKKIKD